MSRTTTTDSNQQQQFDNQQYVEFFRHSSPYIHAHRDKTLVLLLGGEALASDNFPNIINDIALLSSLGVRLVLVHGARPQIDQRLQERGIETQLHHHRRVTDEAALDCVKEAVGSLRTELEARLSMSLANSPMHGAKLKVCSGNFVIAKPSGVVDGVDYCHTGEIRRVDGDAIAQQLDLGSIVLLSNLGYSPTGEVFNLLVEDVAAEAASALKADKLICFGKENGVVNQQGERHSELLTKAAARLVSQYRESLKDNQSPHTELSRQLDAISKACQGGVERGHLLSYEVDGALLIELFTRDGSGTMVSQESYEQIRQAEIEDVAGIIELIEPLEAQGVLVRRSREMLETEIERFTVVERDGVIIGCAALYPYTNSMVELACVAVDSGYQGGNRGEQLLKEAEKQARALGAKQIFLLTTRTAHWFQEQGFAPAGLDVLPTERQTLYNYQRNSKVFVKTL